MALNEYFDCILTVQLWLELSERGRRDPTEPGHSRTASDRVRESNGTTHLTHCTPCRSLSAEPQSGPGQSRRDEGQEATHRWSTVASDSWSENALFLQILEKHVMGTLSQTVPRQWPGQQEPPGFVSAQPLRCPHRTQAAASGR